jgi:hypothetical protein
LKVAGSDTSSLSVPSTTGAGVGACVGGVVGGGVVGGGVVGGGVVGGGVGFPVGVRVGGRVGPRVAPAGNGVGANVGGAGVGFAVVGDPVGVRVGVRVGGRVGPRVAPAGNGVGGGVGTGVTAHDGQSLSLVPVGAAPSVPSAKQHDLYWSVTVLPISSSTTRMVASEAVGPDTTMRFTNAAVLQEVATRKRRYTTSASRGRSTQGRFGESVAVLLQSERSQATSRSLPSLRYDTVTEGVPGSMFVAKSLGVALIRTAELERRRSPTPTRLKRLADLMVSFATFSVARALATKVPSETSTVVIF